MSVVQLWGKEIGVAYMLCSFILLFFKEIGVTKCVSCTIMGIDMGMGFALFSLFGLLFHLCFIELGMFFIAGVYVIFMLAVAYRCQRAQLLPWDIAILASKEI